MATTTLVQETGSGSATANSYVTATQLSQYAEDRNITLSGTYGDTTQVLYAAMDYLDSVDFIGLKLTKAQALQWPRSYAVIDGYSIDTDEIPDELTEAQLAIALSIDQGYTPLPNVDRKVKKEKVDVLEVEYADDSASVAYASRIARSLAKLVRSGGGGNNFRVLGG